MWRFTHSVPNERAAETRRQLGLWATTAFRRVSTWRNRLCSSADQLAEQFPGLAVEARKLHLSRCVEIVRRCIDYDARQQHGQFKVLNVGASRMMFSRERSSPHFFNTWTIIPAVLWA
jgi:hypothetical protein